MPQLLNVWPSVADRIRRAHCTLVLFDYDGTLTPIVDRPELAVLADNVRQCLANLAERSNFILGVISGRGLDDVSQKVGLPGLVYAGNHGLEIKGPGVNFLHPAAKEFRANLDLIKAELAVRLGDFPGALIEDKGLTLSVHFRLVPEELAPKLENEFLEVLKPHQDDGRARVTRGKMVLEVRPNVDWDKGKAILELARVFPQASSVMYFGDDVTDEDGFLVVQEMSGVAVFVGAARQPTRALYRLDSPDEVRLVLELLDGLEPDSS